MSPAHVDVFVGAVAKLDVDERDRFVARGDFLADVAEHATPGEFARTVRAEVLRSSNEVTGSTDFATRSRLPT